MNGIKGIIKTGLFIFLCFYIISCNTTQIETDPVMGIFAIHYSDEVDTIYATKYIIEDSYKGQTIRFFEFERVVAYYNLQVDYINGTVEIEMIDYFYIKKK